MACGKNNTPRITQQVQQILKTLKPAPIELQQLAGFIGQCYIFSDLSIKNPHTIIVDTTNARIGHYNSRTKRFYEVITRGEWTTVPFVIDPNDSKHQAIGKHTAIFLAGFISTRTPEHIENLINSGYFNDFSVNHQTGNVNDDHHNTEKGGKTDMKTVKKYLSGGDIMGKGIGFRRIRRVTGYLTGDVKFMNDSKRAEVSDRTKHA